MSDHLDYFTFKKRCNCPSCSKPYEVVEDDQTPGFKMTSYEKCPWCGYIISTSMEVEFTTSKVVDGGTN